MTTPVPIRDTPVVVPNIKRKARAKVVMRATLPDLVELELWLERLEAACRMSGVKFEADTEVSAMFHHAYGDE